MLARRLKYGPMACGYCGHSGHADYWLDVEVAQVLKAAGASRLTEATRILALDREMTDWRFWLGERLESGCESLIEGRKE